METKFRHPVRVFDGQVLRELQAGLRGYLISPDHPEYEAARRIWNGYIDRYPALIVRCLDENDVARAIRFARARDLTIAVRSGGHSFPGYSAVEDGLVIDLSLMKDVSVDIERQTAQVGAGVKLGELLQVTERYGLVTPVGTASDTGLAGLTLGGGFGFLTGKYGLTCDNVISFTMVTADGTVVRASAEANLDLFWALRGGGGNFGVVTMFEFRLHPQPGVVAGMLIHPAARAAEVLQYYREVCEKAPDELTVFAALITSPEGHPLIAMIPCYSGDPLESERILEPLRKFGPPLADQVHHQSYLELTTMLDQGLPPGWNYYDKGCTFSHLSDAAIEAMVEAGASRPSPLSVVLLQQMHGRAARVPAEETAYPIRSVNYTPVIVSVWTEGPPEPHIEWARRSYATFQPHAIEQTYVNFISDEEQALVPSVYGSNYARLRELKRRYDPDNIFWRNANIKP